MIITRFIMKFPLYISIISMLLVSCSSMNKVVLTGLDKDSKITTASYPKHKLQEGDILHVKIIGVRRII